jgi:hypothetical protein
MGFWQRLFKKSTRRDPHAWHPMTERALREESERLGHMPVRGEDDPVMRFMVNEAFRSGKPMIGNVEGGLFSFSPVDEDDSEASGRGEERKGETP